MAFALTGIDTGTLARVLDLSPSANWTLIAANRGKQVWRVDVADRSYAVRLLRPGEHATAAHEDRMMRAARADGLPVAQVHRIANVANRPALLIDWTGGTDLSARLRRRPWHAGRLGRLAGIQQARLHGCSGPAESNWITDFAPLDEPLRSRLADVQQTSCLLHLDYHPGNLVTNRGEIAGILDWTNARYGDPRADLARTWMLLRLFRSSRRRPMARLAELLFRRAWWQAYCQLRGEPRDMPVFLAWAVAGELQGRGTLAPDADGRKLLPLYKRLRAAAALPPLR